MPLCQQTQSFCANTTWDEHAGQLFWAPVICQAVLALLMPCIAFGFGKVTGSKGSEFQLASRKKLIFVISCSEGVFSLACAGIWINRTYSHRVTSESKAIEMILCIFFILNYFFNAARDGWPFHYVWCLAPMIDVLTVSSVLAIPDADKTSWIGWGHLRVFRALVAYEYAEKLTGLQALSIIKRATIKSLLRTAAVVSALGGTVMLLEVLGDPEFVFEREIFISTDMGDISLIQIVYYIFTTMSTVGYGDFSPTTVLSRLFIIFTIVYGIILFTEELGTIQYLRYIEESGRGRYLPPMRGIRHIIVIGGGVRRPGAVLMSLLSELYEQEHWVHGWPACCLMSIKDQPESLKNFIAGMPPHARSRLQYFVGSSMDVSDLERLRLSSAQLVIVIPDVAAPDSELEDEQNIVRALAVARAYPKKPLFLATIQPSSMKKALRVGLKASRCFSLNRWKSYMFSQSCLCRGWVTFITNLMTSHDLDSNFEREELWLREYKQGHGMEIYAFCLKASFVGQPFSSLIKECMEHPLGIMPIAVVIQGHIVLNPLHYTFEGRDIVFVLATSHDSYSYFEEFADMDTDWEELFQDSRQDLVPIEDVPHLRDGQWQVCLDRKIKDDPHDNDGIWSIGEEQRRLCDSNALKIAAQGKHYLLILLGLDGGIWQQVGLFVALLRGPTLPCKVPILVLSPKPGPDAVAMSEVFRDDPTCSFMLGDASSMDDLYRAGVTEASTIVLLATSCSSKVEKDSRMVDSSGVIILNTIEAILYENKRQIPILCELVRPESMKLLTSVPKMHMGAGNYESATVRANPLWHLRQKLGRVSQYFVDEDESEEEEEEFESVLEGPFHQHPRFANGGVFIMSALGALLAQRCFTPGIIEIMRALICGEDQHSFPWQITVPREYVGKEYKELVVAFAREPWNASCLGLYRQSQRQDTSQVQYMFTNPLGGTPVKPDDFAVVLGTAQLGKLCSERQLLAFQKPLAPPKVVPPVHIAYGDPRIAEDVSQPLLNL